MIEPSHHGLSIAAQCWLLSISRSSYYYAPVPESEETLALMRMIDAFLDMPWYGSRQMARHLRRGGHDVGRCRVRRLMAKMGLSAIYQRPRTSDPPPQHRVYPYLLRKLAIERPNHVWCADVTYIPMHRGFLYLVAIMDWATRGPGLAVVEHDGCRLLCRGAGGASGLLRQAGDIQHGSGQPVHQLRLHQRTARRRGADQHGRPRPVDGQCLHRAPLAILEVQVRLSPCLRNRLRAAGWPGPVDHLLQSPATPLGADRANPGRGLWEDRRIRPWGHATMV